MDSDAIRIRQADKRDRQRIADLHEDAFGPNEGPVIAALVGEILDDDSAVPLYSFVAKVENEIVGHLLLTAASIEPGCQVSTQLLAPLAVRGDHQGVGVGSRLVQEALPILRESGVELVFVLGYPEYYRRFGFSPAGIQTPYPIGAENADAWMVLELNAGAIQRTEGMLRCCHSLDHPRYWCESS